VTNLEINYFGSQNLSS